MKRAFAWILLTILMLFAVGCGQKQEAEEPETEMNPYFTCTGTEYGPYPIIPPEEKKAEMEAFFKENRELLERAAAEMPDQEHFFISNGKAYNLDEVKDSNSTLDPSTLPESLQKLVEVSEETGIYAHRNDPQPVFSAEADPYFKVYSPMAIDTTVYDPGTLYEIWLIYTTNTKEQMHAGYPLEPLAENWYIYIYYYAY